MKKKAFCPDCISFQKDCNPDREDYNKYCESYVKDSKDIPLEELTVMCSNILNKGGTFWVKFTCDHCGSRQTSDAPNKIHVDGYSCECCGKVTIPKLWGIAVMFALPNPNIEVGEA